MVGTTLWAESGYIHVLRVMIVYFRLWQRPSVGDYKNRESVIVMERVYDRNKKYIKASLLPFETIITPVLRV